MVYQDHYKSLYYKVISLKIKSKYLPILHWKLPPLTLFLHSNASWSGSDVTCDILHCDILTDVIDNSVLVSDCGSEFGSVCSVECNTGYRAVGNDTFTCVSVNDAVEWRNNITGGSFQCSIGKLNNYFYCYA